MGVTVFFTRIPPMNNQQKLIIGLLAAVIVVGSIWYVAAQNNNHGASNANTTNQVIVSNKNENVSANTNASTNTNTTTELQSIEYSQLSLMHPKAWEAKTISGAPDCRGFTSPERKAYNKAFASNTNGSATDAVALYDVTICNQDKLSGSLQAAAEKWINDRGASDVSAARMNDPIPGAVRYTISLIRTYDVTFFERDGNLIRVSLEQLPYQQAVTNQTEIKKMLQSVR